LGAVAEPAQAHPKVDPAKVDLAVDKGGQYLLGAAKKGFATAYRHPQVGAHIRRDEMALYALIYAGVDRSDPEFKRLLDRAVNDEIKYTYHAAIQALALEALDARTWQWRIAQCAQFLVDNQCENGQWGYGKPVPLPKVTPSSAAAEPRKTASGGSGPPSESVSGGGEGGTSARKKLPAVPVVQRARGPKTGDNSNTQYALLGLRACLEAGVQIPVSVFAEADAWWEKDQNSDKGWGYALGTLRKDSYASMTEGAVGSLAITKHYTGRDFRKSTKLQDGLAWLAANFSVTEVPKMDRPSAGAWLYYHLYAMERVGMLAGTETIGTHEWYPEGAAFLLEKQAANGSWAEEGGGDPVVDTCYAILFLRRATRALPKIRTR
jgi:hypothetical protein